MAAGVPNPVQSRYTKAARPHAELFGPVHVTALEPLPAAVACHM